MPGPVMVARPDQRPRSWPPCWLLGPFHWVTMKTLRLIREENDSHSQWCCYASATVARRNSRSHGEATSERPKHKLPIQVREITRLNGFKYPVKLRIPYRLVGRVAVEVICGTYRGQRVAQFEIQSFGA